MKRQNLNHIEIPVPSKTQGGRAKLAAFLGSLVRPALGLVRYALTLALFCVVWWYDARYLNMLFDMNLAIIKGVGGLVDGSGKVEAMLRAFAAEKMLLFGEGSGLIWGIGKAFAAAARQIGKQWPGKPADDHRREEAGRGPTARDSVTAR